MELSRLEKLAKIKAEKEAKRKEWEKNVEEEQIRIDQEQASRGGKGFTPAVYTSLVEGGFGMYRLIGDNIPMKWQDVEKAFDPVMFEESLIMGDNDKYHKVRIPYGEKHILKDIFYTVCEYRFDKEANQKIYKHADSPLFSLVRKNKQESNPYASGWQFKKYIGWNVIDRSKMDWHRQENQTMLLTKKLTDDVEGNVYPDATGIPYTLYQRNAKIDEESGMPEKTMTIYETVKDGFYSDYDIIIWRKKYDKSQKLSSVRYWYKVWKATEKIGEVDDSTKSFWDTDNIDSPYGEFEIGLKKYNLQMLCKPTSYKRIKEWFGKTIYLVDQEFGTNYYSELKRLVAKEEEEGNMLISNSLFVDDLNEEVSDEETDSSTVTENEEDNKNWSKEPPFETESDKKDKKRVSRRPVKKDEPTEEKSIFDLAKDNDMDLSKLSAESIAEIKDFVDGKIIFDASVGEDDIEPCPECELEIPLTWSSCPKCGTEFEDA